MRRLNKKQTDFQESLDRLKCKALKSNFPKKLTIASLRMLQHGQLDFLQNLNNDDDPKILPWATAHPKLLALSERQRELKPTTVVT